MITMINKIINKIKNKKLLYPTTQNEKDKILVYPIIFSQEEQKLPRDKLYNLLDAKLEMAKHYFIDKLNIFK